MTIQELMDVLTQLDPNKVILVLDRENHSRRLIDGISIEPDGTVVLD